MKKETTKISKKNLKSKFYKKIAQICDIKKLKNCSMTIQNLSVTYYQTHTMFCGLWDWNDPRKEKMAKI